MYTSVNMRSANPFRPASGNAYQQVAAETAVFSADPHQLVHLLFEALQQSLVKAKGAMLKGDIVAKGQAIGRSVRILEEGLKAGLDVDRGGELALNLRTVYDICILKLTEANFHNRVELLDEVSGLVEPLADGWTQIKADIAVTTFQS